MAVSFASGSRAGDSIIWRRGHKPWCSAPQAASRFHWPLAPIVSPLLLGPCGRGNYLIGRRGAQAMVLCTPSRNTIPLAPGPTVKSIIARPMLDEVTSSLGAEGTSHSAVHPKPQHDSIGPWPNREFIVARPMLDEVTPSLSAGGTSHSAVHPRPQAIPLSPVTFVGAPHLRAKLSLTLARCACKVEPHFGRQVHAMLSLTWARKCPWALTLTPLKVRPLGA